MTDIPKARSDEILQWLERRVTAEDAIAEIRRDENRFARHGSADRACSELFRTWVSRFDSSTAELWRYDSGGDSWEQLCGECGFAVVFDGKLVDFWVWFEN